jgi:hypothetical protein
MNNNQQHMIHELMLVLLSSNFWSIGNFLIVVAIGSKFEVKRNYFILGSKVNKMFNAMAALFFIGFAFNVAILLELLVIWSLAPPN